MKEWCSGNEHCTLRLSGPWLAVTPQARTHMEVSGIHSGQASSVPATIPTFRHEG